MSRFYEEMSHTVERHGGTAAKFIGDAVMAVFGMPALHEDDALRAVRAAAEMGPALNLLNDELQERWGVRLQVRVGVNTGEVVVANPAPGQSLAVEEVVGDAVNVAARLERAAATGEVLIGPDTHLLVRDAIEAEPVEPLELKGKARPVRAWRLLGVSAAGRHIPVARIRRIVGRERELGLLDEALRARLPSSGVELVTLVGAAGIGKSRLVRELVARVEDRHNHSERALPPLWRRHHVLARCGDPRKVRASSEGKSRRWPGKVAGLLHGERGAADMVRGLAGAIGVADASSDREEIAGRCAGCSRRLAHKHPLIV